MHVRRIVLTRREKNHDAESTSPQDGGHWRITYQMG